MTELQRDLADLLNRHSRENESGTADFLLAEFLTGCLETFEASIRARDAWWNFQPKIGGLIPAYGPLSPDEPDTAATN